MTPGVSCFTAIGPNQVHAWFAKLVPSQRSLPELHEILSSDERQRAAQFRFDLHRARFVVARATLRLLLGRYLQLRPEKIVFQYGNNGKPALAEGGIHFNVSHSEDRGLFAFSSSTPLGADLEFVREMPDASRIAARFFSPSEALALAVVPRERQARAFFKCWTRKEAFVKAIAEGLSHPLDRFSVSFDEPARLLHIDGDPNEAGQWTVHHLEPEEEYLGAIALRERSGRLLTFSFPEGLCGAAGPDYP